MPPQLSGVDDDDSLPGAIHPVSGDATPAAAAATTVGLGGGEGEPLTQEERMRRYQGALRDALVDRARVRTFVLVVVDAGRSIDGTDGSKGRVPNSM